MHESRKVCDARLPPPPLSLPPPPTPPFPTYFVNGSPPKRQKYFQTLSTFVTRWDVTKPAQLQCRWQIWCAYLVWNLRSCNSLAWSSSECSLFERATVHVKRWWHTLVGRVCFILFCVLMRTKFVTCSCYLVNILLVKQYMFIISLIQIASKLLKTPSLITTVQNRYIHQM